MFVLCLTEANLSCYKDHVLQGQHRTFNSLKTWRSLDV